MTFNGFFRGLGDIFQWTFQFLQADAIGNIFNYSLIVLGFVGLFYWLNLQKKFNEKAKNDSSSLK
jgi:hypothetical protein